MFEPGKSRMGGGDEWDDDASDGGGGLEAEMLQGGPRDDAIDTVRECSWWL